MTQSSVAEQMKCTTAVGNGSAKDRIGSIWRDQALLNMRIAAGTSVDHRGQVLPILVLIPDGVENGKQERMNYIRAVIVPVKVGAIAISAVAGIPQHVFAKGIIHPRALPRFSQGEERGFNACRKQEPVIHGRLERSDGAQRFSQLGA